LKIREFYQKAVELGIENDPRGKETIEKILDKNRKKYEKAEEEEKKFFDPEKLTNPFSDTRILTGNLEEEIEGLIAGIDMEVGEVLLADRLREKGEKINLILAHHPEGKALADLSEVMYLQADVWHRFGVPINIGDALISDRAREVFRALLPVNHQRAVDAARLLGFAMICLHTPADNMVTAYLQKYLEEKEPYTLDEVVKALKEIPEYQEAARNNAGPVIIVGSESYRAGKIMVDMTGGTEGPEGVIEKLAQSGVGTLVCMHMDDKLKKKAEENKVNVVIAGHIASDTLGLNLLLDEVEKIEPLKIISTSGFRRIKRS